MREEDFLYVEVQGLKWTVVKSHIDVNLAELWDTCNNNVISWIMGSVSESIARSIMCIGTIFEMWKQLDMRFSVSDGSRKYRLNKDTYGITQSGCSIGAHYTKMKCVWKELDSLNALSVIATITPKITMFLNALTANREMLGKVGYPPWHSKFKGSQGKQNKNGQVQNINQFGNRTAAHVESGNISFTPHQFEQLLRSMQQLGSSNGSEEEIDHHYVADHMTLVHEPVLYPYLLKIKPQIKLPNGNTSVISQVGKDLATRKVNGLGKYKDGLYHLVNVPSD
uniref:Uncharacterized protein n=1 Tax=Tanacetum cinerariifolium TaxID=118510 RepID=A0A6L2LMD4_TANCI|nr:hypothetical protein CTI12_AA183640 [Tanacetum cinerariifolium]